MIKVYLELVLMIILWGFSFVVVDIAVEFIPPLSIAFYRFLIASITFIIIDVVSRFRNKTISAKNNLSDHQTAYSKNDWILVLFASFTGISFFFLAQYTAIDKIGPSLPALFVCLISPIVISLLALIFFKERLNKIKIIGLVIATFGGFLLITGGNLKTLTPESPGFIGYLFALLTPFLWAIYSTITKKITKVKSKFYMLKYIAYFGTIELFVFLLISGEFIVFITNFLNVILLLCGIYIGIGCYILGYYIWQNSQEKLNSSKTASFLYVEPFITLFFSYLLQRSESIVFWNIAGGIIVLIAVLIINYK